jgi:hypothetical protein
MKGRTPLEMTELMNETAQEEIRVSGAERRRWDESPCTVARQQWLLMALAQTWDAMLNATCWEEFIQYRGAYRFIEGFLAEEPIVDNEEFTQPDQVERIRATLKEVLNGSGNRDNNES